MKKNDREYRSMTFETRAKDEAGNEEFRVSGYASTFDPYVLFEEDGIKYSEKIEPTAFDEADLSDVIFLYNHEGMVYARQKNGTLKLSIDKHGLKVDADLSSTKQSQEMFEQIRSGLIDQMSFAFTVSEDSYDRTTHTRIIRKINKVYDVSAVSIPANAGTDIGVSTRSFFDGVIEEERTERFEREKAEALELRKQQLLLLGKIRG